MSTRAEELVHAALAILDDPIARPDDARGFLERAIDTLGEGDAIASLRAALVDAAASTSQERDLRAIAVQLGAIVRTRTGRTHHHARTIALLGGLAVVGIAFAIVIARATERPWRMEVYDNPELTGQPTVSRATSISEHVWSEQSPAAGVRADAFSVRLSTCLYLAQATQVHFYLVADDGGRLLVDGHAVIDAWRPDNEPSADAAIDLGAGPHHVRVEHHDLAGSASLRLVASIGDEPPAFIPNELLEQPAIEDGADVCE